MTKLIASDAAAVDELGWSLAPDGDTLIAGAPFCDIMGASDAGAAYVFVREGDVWTEQAKLTASDASADDWVGLSVAIAGNTAVLGAPHCEHGGQAGAGAAYICVRDSGIWVQEAKLNASDEGPDDRFGVAVAVDGDTAVIGASSNDEAGENAGAAYVFVRCDGIWTQQAKLMAADASSYDYFGSSIAVDGETAIIGAPFDSNADGAYAGAAYVFVRSGGEWTQQAKLTASEWQSGDSYFGHSVALYSDTAAVGRPHGLLGPGAAYLFVRSGGTWTRQAKVEAADPEWYAEFGSSVALADGTLIVGAPRSGYDAGAVYVFGACGGAWTSQGKLIAPDAGGFFGDSVGINGVTAMFGARYYSHDGLEGAGAVYSLDLVGACCLGDGTCVSYMTPPQCAEALGSLHVGETCDSFSCFHHPCRGDLNCDGAVSFADINPFVLYLSNYDTWQSTYPACDPVYGDINGDGTWGQWSFGDINPFVDLIANGQGPCP
jgi:hypothetical protein